MDISANRRRVLAVLIVCVGSAFAVGLTVTGAFRADIQTRRGVFGPVRLGIDGGMGEGGAPAQVAPARLPQQPRPATLMAAGGGSYPLTITSAPYNGPTAEERALLHALREATRASYAQALAETPSEARAMLPPMAEIKLPPRHLTSREISDIRDAIELLENKR